MSYVVSVSGKDTNESTTASPTVIEKNMSLRLQGQSRHIEFRRGIFIKYFIVDLISQMLGPFGFVCATPCWGMTAAINMNYFPGSRKDAFGMLITNIIFWPLFYTPFFYGIFVATGWFPGSDFDPLSETVPLALMLLLGPCPSAFKYAFMPKRRFEETVLSKHFKREGNTMMDGTADSIGMWISSLKDALLERELDAAIWRSGKASDGGHLKFVPAHLDSHEDNDKALETISLRHMLRSIIQRNRSSWQFSLGKLQTLSFFVFFLPFGLIPSFFRNYRGRPFFGGGPDGGSTLDTIAIVYSFIATAIMFCFSFWQIFASGGHLQRNLNIMEDWLNLLLFSVRNAVEDTAQNDEVMSLDNGYLTKIALTGRNLRVWARGREVLLQYGEIYWLRLSWMTALGAFQMFGLLAILIVQVLLSLLSGDTIQLTPFMVMSAGWVLAFSFALSLLVLIGLGIIRARSMMRTQLLRYARNCLLIEAKNSENYAQKNISHHSADRLDSTGTAHHKLKDLYEAAQEMRVLAYEHECEMESHKVRLLGLPLDMRMLESLFGGVVAIALMFYQTK